MRDEYDCQEFMDFSRQFGDELASDMVQRICECHYARDYKRDKDISFGTIDSCGDGLNYTLHGTINHGARCWDFEIEDGNANGTAINTWDRCWKYACLPVPPQSFWLLAPWRAIYVRLLSDHLEPALIAGFTDMMENNMGKRILAAGDPVEIRFFTQDGSIWRPATVLACNKEKISISYCDGTRHDIQNVYHERYRIPEKRPNE